MLLLALASIDFFNTSTISSVAGGYEVEVVEVEGVPINIKMGSNALPAPCVLPYTGVTLFHVS